LKHLLTAATLTVAFALLGACALAGCGGGTKTVSASSAVGANSGGSTPSTDSTARDHSTPTTTTPSQQASTAQTTRTAPAPAFTKEASGGQASSGEAVSGAVAVVKAHGYTPGDTSQYHPDQTLRVLLATRTGSADGYAQQAFFFVGGRYVGTDTSAPSAGIRLVSQGDTEVALAYRLYRPGDSLCCARGGEATVRFQLNNGRLVALDPIPPVSSSTGTSRQ
jgi:hypothetical protein